MKGFSGTILRSYTELAIVFVVYIYIYVRVESSTHRCVIAYSRFVSQATWDIVAESRGKTVAGYIRQRLETASSRTTGHIYTWAGTGMLEL